MIDRYEWLGRLAKKIPDDALVMSTMIGAVCYEWAALTEENPRNSILSLMGFGIALATGIALALPHRKVVCIDGDGSVLLELGQLVLLGQERPKNLVIFVVDNAAYESIGTTKGARPRPTATASSADLAAIALGSGVPYAKNVKTMDEFERELNLAFSEMECRFINVRTKTGPCNVPPRQFDGIEDKYRFVRHVERLEGRRFMTRQLQDLELMKGRKGD